MIVVVHFARILCVFSQDNSRCLPQNPDQAFSWIFAFTGFFFLFLTPPLLPPLWLFCPTHWWPPHTHWRRPLLLASLHFLSAAWYCLFPSSYFAILHSIYSLRISSFVWQETLLEVLQNRDKRKRISALSVSTFRKFPVQFPVIQPHIQLDQIDDIAAPALLIIPLLLPGEAAV